MSEMERMLAWLDDAFRAGLWPAQLDGREKEFRRVYAAIRSIVESSTLTNKERWLAPELRVK